MRPAWATADSVELTQVEPQQGAPATARTVVRVLSGSDALYIGVRAYESDTHAVRATQLRRDADLTVDDYVTLLIVDQLTSNIVIHTFAYKVQDGTLAGELIRPIHPMLTNALVNNIAFKTLTILGFIPIWIILFLAFRPDFSHVAWQGIALSIPAMLLGFVIGFLLSASITCLAFWTTRVYSLHEFYYGLILLFSGQFVPLTLMPKMVQDIAQYLPFQLFIYYPIQLILGKLSPPQILQGFVSGGIWLGISILVFNWVWRNGVRQFSAVGA